MAKKLTPALVAQIQARRAQGETLESISKAVGLSVGTVHAATRTRPTSKKAPRSPAPAAPTPAPDVARLPTPEDLRRDLASQVRSLRAELAAAETPAMRATLNRLLVSAQQLLTRVTPLDPSVPPEGMMLVPAGEMRDLAQVVGRRLDALIVDQLKEIEAWPICRACGQPVQPKESP